MKKFTECLIFVALTALIFVFSMKIYKEGFEHGLSMKKPPSIIMNPPCRDSAIPADVESDSVLWRI